MLQTSKSNVVGESNVLPSTNWDINDSEETVSRICPPSDFVSKLLVEERPLRCTSNVLWSDKEVVFIDQHAMPL
jgi:hypothetical protein